MSESPIESTEATAPLSQQELLGLSRLAVQAVIGVTDVVEAMHGTISRVPPPLGRRRPRRARGLSGQIYASVRGITRVVGGGLEAAHRWLPDIRIKTRTQLRREAMISRINGVVGDHLEATANPLAITMRLRQQGRTVFDPKTGHLELPRHPRPVVLIHGLCMNDLQWTAAEKTQPARKDGHHDHGLALARDLDLAPLYLHYNTGRHISENGRDLSELLQALVEHWPVALESLDLIGHSMGGLVIRSACHQGERLGHDWMQHLHTAVFLGSPHHGAPLERLGNLAERLLGLSPYSAPIARLGQLRSAGIRDLRHGNLLESDWRLTPANAIADHRRPVPMPAHVHVHALAATRSAAEDPALKSDGLVPVASALGEHRDQARSLTIPAAHRELFFETDHFQLLHDQAVYRRIRDCLGSRSRLPR